MPLASGQGAGLPSSVTRDATGLAKISWMLGSFSLPASGAASFASAPVAGTSSAAGAATGAILAGGAFAAVAVGGLSQPPVWAVARPAPVKRSEVASKALVFMPTSLFEL